MSNVIVGGVTSINNPRTNWNQTDSNKADYLKNKPDVANSIKQNKRGSIIKADDVSPIEHSLKVNVEGKNLMPFPYNKGNETINGVTFTHNGDGTVTVNGEATANAVHYVFYNIGNPLTFPSGIYTISGSPIGSTYAAGYYISLNYGINGTFKDTSIGEKGNSIELDAAKAIAIVIKKGIKADNLVFKPQIEKGTTATDWTPYVANVGSVNVSRYGKNLIPYPHLYTTRTLYGVDFTDNGDGTVTANGTATGAVFFKATDLTNGTRMILPKGTYFLSGSPIGGSTGTFATYIVVYDMNGSEQKRYWDTGNGVKFDLPLENQIISVVLYITSGTTVKNITFRPQIEVGETATEYESYIAPQTVAANTDGIVEGLTSASPSMTLVSDTNGVIIDCTYKADTELAVGQMINKNTESVEQMINEKTEWENDAIKLFANGLEIQGNSVVSNNLVIPKEDNDEPSADDTEITTLLKKDLEDFTNEILQKDFDLGFLAVTDIHALKDDVYKIMAYFAENHIGDFVVNLGDNTHDQKTKKAKMELLKKLFEVSQSGKGLEVYNLRGNHDNNPQGSFISRDPNTKQYITTDENYPKLKDKSFHISDKQYYNISTRTPKELRRLYPNNYFYRDFEDSKIRAIFLDGGDIYDKYTGELMTDALNVMYQQDQIDWLVDTALNFSDKTDKLEWSVLTLSHCQPIFIEPILKAFMDGASVEGEYTYNDTYAFEPFTVSWTCNFATMNRCTMEYLGHISGHYHKDRAFDIFNQITDPDEQRKRIEIRNATVNNTDTPTVDDFAIDFITINKNDAGLVTIEAHRFGNTNANLDKNEEADTVRSFSFVPKFRREW